MECFILLQIISYASCFYFFDTRSNILPIYRNQFECHSIMRLYCLFVINFFSFFAISFDTVVGSFDVNKIQLY